MSQVIKTDTYQGTQIQAATVAISHRALQHNLQRFRELTPTSEMVAVVKANAYGHGLLKTARTLLDADAFGVARLEETLRLRAGGVTKPILLLEGFFNTRNLPTVSAQHFHTAVYNEEQLATLEEASLDEPAAIWMELGIGVHRLGVRPEQAEVFYHRLTQRKDVRRPANIVSRFVRVDEPKCGATGKQLAIFNTFCEGKSGQRSIAASSDILLWPQSHFNQVCPSIILYGVSPLKDHSTGADFGCQSVMSLTSNLITVREHKAGEPVGYDGTWVSERDIRLGVVAMGYGDDYPHAAPSGTPVLMSGREVPAVGRMVMDIIYVGLGLQTQDKTRDPVILWDEGLPVEHIAEMTRVSAYELITRLTSRVAMKYVG